MANLSGQVRAVALRPGTPPDVTVVEVAPRDGLQNESVAIPTAVKIAFIDALGLSGLTVIEATSFVNPKAVPQLADAAEVMRGIDRRADVLYPVLVPNMRGLERAFEAGVNAIALFTAATDQFAAANVGTSIAGTFERFEPIAVAVRERRLWLRGYVSVAFGCPYAGAVRADDVLPVAERLLSLGCDEICLADTIGTATPELVRQMLKAARRNLPFDRLALHFHDTSGSALSNVDEALDHGIRIFDAAAGGLGGCPFAPGAPGNLGTERLVDHLHGRGAPTGVDVEAIAAAIALVAPYLSRQQPSPA